MTVYIFLIIVGNTVVNPMIATKNLKNCEKAKVVFLKKVPELKSDQVFCFKSEILD